MPQTAQFWIYENVPMRKAVLHHRSCGNCKDGQGNHGKRDESRSWWRRFDTIEEARSAEITPGNVPRDCPCIARLGFG
jgi:hypothetical protein